MSRTMKLFSRVIGRRPRSTTCIAKVSFSLCQVDSLQRFFFLLQQVIQKYRERNQDTCYQKKKKINFQEDARQQEDERVMEKLTHFF